MKYTLLLLCIWVQISYGQVTLAVLPFTGSKTLSSDEIQVITDRFTTEMIKTGKFRVLERGEMNKILEEQGFQESGSCDDSDCRVQMGQLLGVEKLVMGSLGKIENLISMNMKMINVATGQIEASHAIDLKGGMSEVLTKGCQQMAQNLSGTKSNKKVASPSFSKSWVWAGAGIGILTTGIVIYFITQKSEKKVTTTEDIVL